MLKIGTSFANSIDNLMEEKKIKLLFLKANGPKIHKIKFRLLLVKTHL